jgi:hypothetical protein
MKGLTKLPIEVRIALAVGIAGGIIYAVYKLFTVPRNIEEGKEARQEDREWNRELERCAGRFLLPKAQTDAYANKLFTALNGYGTDEDAIYETLRKIKSDCDYVALNASYGIREISSGNWNPEPNFKGNLTSSLVHELGTDERAKVNAILKNNKITYRI